ncbi:NeuD/PglB/VioB family sugar acetyltransferase [Paenibacillus cymbidii]|uniref:NeuD/PglB/VioB family sugar acetyltransferase n=1 Tax=Paenibacillus cymbidii TaxID=1639034 RepID=UPI001081AA30|nr:NeuD/PglB/VioB family sugar acetyltransferase [Paenibacillus cymbidii]
MKRSRPCGKEVILWGGTGQAKVLWECLALAGYTLAAVFDRDERLTPPVAGVPLFASHAFDDWLRQRDADDPTHFAIAIGGDKGRDRIRIHDVLVSKGLTPLTVIHPDSYLSPSAIVESGAQILVRAIVGVQTRIGKQTIVNSGAIVEHECIVGEGVHIGPGATLAGCVEIADYATIYTGAVILPRVQIGRGATVGAGAVVTQNVPPHHVVAGNPSRTIKVAETANDI